RGDELPAADAPAGLVRLLEGRGERARRGLHHRGDDRAADRRRDRRRRRRRARARARVRRDRERRGGAGDARAGAANRPRLDRVAHARLLSRGRQRRGVQARPRRVPRRRGRRGGRRRRGRRARRLLPAGLRRARQGRRGHVHVRVRRAARLRRALPRARRLAPAERAGAGAPGRERVALRVRGWLDARLRGLFPGSFALVMATGIVSNGFYFLGQRSLSLALLAFNLGAYPLLLLATVCRAVRFGRELWRDLVDPRLVFTFFTLVAGSDILGAQLHLRGHDDVATGLWLFALAVWVVL